MITLALLQPNLQLLGTEEVVLDKDESSKQQISKRIA